MQFPIPWHLEFLEETASTNSLAMERAKKALLAVPPNITTIHGSAILAARQSAGRGQHQRTWASPPGGLYLSATLANIPDPLGSLLPLFAGLAVAHSIDDALPDAQTPPAQIRWPNDVLVAGKKISGILCESIAIGGSGRLEGSRGMVGTIQETGMQIIVVIGIGMNVNNRVEDFPAALRPAVATLQSLTGRQHDLMSLAASILNGLSDILQNAAANGPQPIIEKINARHALQNLPVTLQCAGEPISGIAREIDSSGALQLLTPKGLMPIRSATILAVAGRPIIRTPVTG